MRDAIRGGSLWEDAFWVLIDITDCSLADCTGRSLDNGGALDGDKGGSDLGAAFMDSLCKTDFGAGNGMVYGLEGHKALKEFLEMRFLESLTLVVASKSAV